MRIFLAIIVLGLAGWPFWGRAQQVQQAPLTRAENDFAIDLYGKLARTPGNLFFSPYSTATVVEMLYVGSKKATAEEIAKTLHLSVLGKTDGRSSLLARLLGEVQARNLFSTSSKDEFRFQAANAIWGGDSFKFDQNFIAAIKAGFSGIFEPIDFMHPEQASAQINAWAAEHTQNKILNAISPELLKRHSPVVLALTNAVYFKAGWAHGFDRRNTRQAEFHLASGHDASAEMMNVQGSFDLSQAEGVKVLNIPYRMSAASMIIILPDDPRGLSGIEAGLTAEKLRMWLASGQNVAVMLSIPKFRMNSGFDLKAPLTALGMKSAFDRTTADFTGIALDPRHRVYVSAFVQKAFIDIDENGTEAAAVTTALASALMVSRQPPVPFIADHPFIYLIQSDESGEILFMGRVDDPTQPGG